MNLFYNASYVSSLKQIIERQDRELAIMRGDLAIAREDARRLVDAIAQSKQFLAPFAAIKNPPNDFAQMRRVSIHREVQELEAKHNTRKEEDE